eukprot:4365737-Prymnesium_polylepis.1
MPRLARGASATPSLAPLPSKRGPSARAVPPFDPPLAPGSFAQVGYHLRTFSLLKGSIGEQLQTVALPNCPFVTSVQFAPLNFAVLIGYGRCQTPENGQTGYAVLRCIQFHTRSQHRLSTEVRAQPRTTPPPLHPNMAMPCGLPPCHRVWLTLTRIGSTARRQEVELFSIDSND